MKIEIVPRVAALGHGFTLHIRWPSFDLNLIDTLGGN
jgi:hypothetical protein